MQTLTTTETEVQEVTSAHPSGFDKWIWTGEISNGRGLSRGAVATALRLAHHHNADTGQCNPSLQTIADALETSVATIKRDMAELKAAGYVTWKVTKNNRNNRYTLKHVRIGDHHTSTATKPSPAKRQQIKGKGPASSIRGNVVQFQPPKAVSDPAPIIRSVVVSFPGAVPQMSPPDSSPVSPPDSSPVSCEPMKDNRQGYPEEVEQKEVGEGTSEASDGPASPLSPGGHRVEQDSADGKQPETETRPADGRFTFNQLSSEFGVRAREWAEVQFQGDQTFIDQASRGFKAVAIERAWRITEGKWHEVWRAYSMTEDRKRPSKNEKPDKKKAS